MLKQDLCWIPMRLNSFEMLPVFCQHIDVGLAYFPSLHCIHRNHSFTGPEDKLITLALDEGFLNLFFGELVDGAFPLIVLLSPVQNDGPVYHLL
jgi:hypothetical protein